MDTAGHREVRRLALLSPPQYVRRAGFLVEDGLRTATLPHSGVWVVRRLPLGVISPHDAPSAVSLRIEHAWRQVAQSAVTVAETAGFAPDAVYFRSIEQASALYLARLLDGPEPREWYWRKILPQCSAAMPVEDAFATILLSMCTASTVEAVLCATSLLEELARLQALEKIVTRIAPQHVAPVMRILFGNRRESAPTRITVPRSQSLPHLFAPVIRTLRADPCAANDVLFFLCLCARLTQAPWLASTPAILAAQARRWMTHETPTIPPFGVGAACNEEQAVPDTIVQQQAVSTTQSPTGAAQQPAPRIETAFRTPASIEPARQDGPAPEPALDLASTRLWGLPQDTMFAGLFFALPVFERLGFNEFLYSHPELVESGLLAQWLTSLAWRAGATPSDPIVAAIFLKPTEIELIDHWISRARRYVRHEARMFLSWVIRRKGVVIHTRTHTDVHFEADQADLRIRRLGLDIDPGWVPALGRVVLFHYGPVIR